MRLGYIGIDQYGGHYNLKEHPRKELLEQLHARKASNVYVDTKDGTVKYVGYLIKGHWVHIYAVHDWRSVG